MKVLASDKAEHLLYQERLRAESPFLLLDCKFWSNLTFCCETEQKVKQQNAGFALFLFKNKMAYGYLARCVHTSVAKCLSAAHWQFFVLNQLICSL